MDFTNRQAVIFCVIMLVLGSLTVWGEHYFFYDWWFLKEPTNTTNFD